MVEPAKKRLTAIFTLIIVTFSIVILVISYLILHHSLVNAVKRHMQEDMRTEFMDQFNRSGLDPFRNMWDEHHFQILNREGMIIVSTRNSLTFYPGLNRGLLEKAFNGKQGFETKRVGDQPNLISYFPLDGRYVGRLAASLEDEVKYERSFLRLVILFFPLMILLSYIVSRYLVNYAMAPLSEMVQFQETFSSNVTHELRSPLAAIKGNLEVTLRRERTAEEYREVIDFGLKETDRIINLLNNLSLLASSKYKPLDLLKNRADIDGIAKDVVDAYKLRIEARRIKLTFPDSRGHSCDCDAGLIKRTVENLLDNAVKYTPDGGSIDLGISRKGRNILLTITNTCEPMDREETRKIFQPFYRSSNPAKMKKEGKGLGLYISRYIVRSHGGDIVVNDSESGVFSLTLTLPARLPGKKI